MKELKDRLQRIRDNQKQLTAEYELALNEFDSNDMILENQLLRQKYEEYKQQVNDLREKYGQSEIDNTKLRHALKEQVMDEKLNILKVSRQKMLTYFKGDSRTHENQLLSLETKVNSEIDKYNKQAVSQLHEEKQEIVIKLEQIHTELNERIQLKRERMAEEEKKLLQGLSSGYDQLASEEVSDEVIAKRMKQNQIEMKIGLNWINKIGMLLIIFGVGAAFKYSYSTWFSDYAKGTVFFLIGALLLVGGEWLFRKNKQTFALGLLGGGLSVLYGSIFYSYFLLDIIGIYTGIALSVVVTLTAVVLSLRYDSRTVCSLGLTGGFFPFFSYMAAFGLEGNAVYAAMGYLFLLNLSVLTISLYKRWIVVNYISFLLNVPSMVTLAMIAASNGISMLYTIITFVMYVTVTLGYSFKYQAKLYKLDIVLLALNTVVSCSLLYYLLSEAGLDDYRGLLALIFCLLYIGLGRFMETVMSQEKVMMVLFYGTALTFAVLIIPFQFGVQWVSLGWLIEGVILIIYGSMARMKSIVRSGWTIFSLCLGAFFYLDVALFHAWGEYNEHFDLKYSFVIAGMMIVTLFYARRSDKRETAINLFKYFALANLWIFLLYETSNLFDHWISDDIYHYSYYKWMIASFVTIGLAYALTKVLLLYDRIVKYYCVFLFGVGCLLCLYMTTQIPVLQPSFAENRVEEYLALGLLIAYNLLIFVAGREILIAFIRRQFKNIELYPMILAVYLLGILTSFLIVQFRMGDVGLLFSLLYLLLAIGYILYGFQKRFVYIRRIGLGLTLLSTGKLFLYDLAFLTAGSKIIAYFCFGVVLLGISYIYQVVSNRMEDSKHEAKA